MHLRILVLGWLWIAACGASDDDGAPDGAADAGRPDGTGPADAASDAPRDDGGDATSDARHDADADSDADARRDAANDAAPDAPPSATTLVRVHYDTGLGNRIAVRGDGGGLGWDAGRDCTWSEGNVWRCELDAASAPFEIKPLVNDETWAKGSNWRVSPGTTLDLWPFFFASSGRIETHAAFRSEILDNTRDVFVYLPPSYDENADKTYPILLMNDGGNMFDPALAFGGVAWEIDRAIDDLASNGPLIEPIVVGVSATVDRMVEYTPSVEESVGVGGDAEPYLRFLVEELLPFVRESYRASDDRASIGGSSLGGLISMYACWTRPADFGRCGVFSPSLWWDDQYMIRMVRDEEAGPDDKPLVIYLDSGDSGTSRDGMDDVIIMRDLLIEKGWVLGENLQYALGMGHSHNETAWQARAPGALAFLLRDTDRVP